MNIKRVSKTKSWVIGISGASGIIYAIKLIAELVKLNIYIDLVFTQTAKLTLFHEHKLNVRESYFYEDMRILFKKLINENIAVDKLVNYITNWRYNDFSAKIASGTYLTHGMIVVPATIGSIAGIACGISKDLVQRATAVTLKESRKLIIVLRETPITLNTLEELVLLSKMGAIIMPASPGFYNIDSNNIMQIIDFMVGKILDSMMIEHQLYKRWGS